MGSGILLETEQFDDFGGWTIDSQFAHQMGSAYLIAHGIGEPVDDAATRFDVTQTGTYRLWVRAKDWVGGAQPQGRLHPGAFEIVVDSAPLEAVCGIDGQDWHWLPVGELNLQSGIHTLALHDLTGFDARCDAIYLTCDEGDMPPDGTDEEARAWRKRMLGIPDAPQDGGTFDLVVVGGGCAGIAAAYVAAQLGATVALIHDRPVLGGNASVEVGLEPRGEVTPFVRMLLARTENFDLVVAAMLAELSRVHVMYNQSLFAAETHDDRIAAVCARDLITALEYRYEARCFVDASGTAALARAAGAQTMAGRESRAAYGESLAPEQPDMMHHGNTLLFHTTMHDAPIPFPEVPWALDVAHNFDDLNGQMGAIGEENMPGPCPSCGGEAVDFSPENIMHYPATHYWEYGQFIDMYAANHEEEVRDHLLRALYGTLANVRNADPATYGGLTFEWLHLVPARGEYQRIVGDHVLTEGEVRAHADFPDAIVRNDSAFCLHYPGDEHDFRLGNWIWDIRDMQPYWIPFSCLYSKNVPNLMMAGKVISTSRVVGSNVKMMANGVQHGIAVGAAAALCMRLECDPRDIRETHMDKLREAVAPYIACDEEPQAIPGQAAYVRAVMNGAIEAGADPTQPETQEAIRMALASTAAAFDRISAKSYPTD